MAVTGRHRPRLRLLLTLAALASLIAGYYLGQYWQRRPLVELSAAVFASGRPLEFPPGTEPGHDQPGAAGPPWRLFVAADTAEARCRDLVRHYALVINRLAAWPDIQARLRLTLLAYDQPAPDAIVAFTGGVEWIDVITAEPESLDRLSSQLDLPARSDTWCTDSATTAVLVSPEQRQWALIPLEQAAMMAHNIRTIIAFVE